MAPRDRYEYERAFAARVVREAGHLLFDPTSPETAKADALQHLSFEMSHEPAVSAGATWVFFADEHVVSVALMDPVHGPVVGAVSRPWTAWASWPRLYGVPVSAGSPAVKAE